MQKNQFTNVRLLMLSALLAGSGMAHATSTPPVTAAGNASEQSAAIQAQAKATGVVKDASGEPVIGASVIVKGTTNGTVTDIDGRFNITGVQKGATLTVSFLGFKEQTVRWNGQPLNIVLAEDDKALDEIVVVGYGTQKKANLTGAVSQVSMDKVLGNRPVANVGAALQGAIPGLVVSTGASPGISSSFNIRGTTSINGGSPLVLIDNVPGDINMLNPEDIESVSVLKDAAAATVYGARSAFGVVLITTKKAKKNERFSINYNNTFGFSDAINLPEQVSTLEYMDIYQHTWGNTHYIQSMDIDKWREYYTQYHSNPSSLPGVEASGRYIDPDGNTYFLNNKNPMTEALTRASSRRTTYRPRAAPTSSPTASASDMSTTTALSRATRTCTSV